MPAAGAVPGTEAHLPAGVDPATRSARLPRRRRRLLPAPEAAPAPGTRGTRTGTRGCTGSRAARPHRAARARTPAPEAAPAGRARRRSARTRPSTQDFMYPSISNGCLDGRRKRAGDRDLGGGPGEDPRSRPGPGQTAYVFTAIGTPGPAAEQKLPLNVTWVNLTTGKSGSATLKPQADINPDGPTTLTAIADTGSGSIMSTIFGQVTTTEKQCQFMPTIGSTVVP